MGLETMQADDTIIGLDGNLYAVTSRDHRRAFATKTLNGRRFPRQFAADHLHEVDEGLWAETEIP